MGRKSSLTDKQWAEIGERLVKGEAGRVLAREYGISEAAIRKRAKQEGWDQLAVSADSKAVSLGSLDQMASAGFVYVIFIDTGVQRLYKIGMAKHFSTRFSQHQCSSPFEIRVAVCYFVGSMRAEERTLHMKFSEKHVRGEWYALSQADLREIGARSVLE
jgi:hypothetical protein